MDTKMGADEIPITFLIIFLVGIFTGTILLIFKILKYIFQKIKLLTKLYIKNKSG